MPTNKMFHSIFMDRRTLLHCIHRLKIKVLKLHTMIMHFDPSSEQDSRFLHADIGMIQNVSCMMGRWLQKHVDVVCAREKQLLGNVGKGEKGKACINANGILSYVCGACVCVCTCVCVHVCVCKKKTR